MQPEDVTDLEYRPVDGDTEKFTEELRQITRPYKKLKEMRAGDKARLSHTSEASMVPAKWSVGPGSASLQIWSSSPKLDRQKIQVISDRIPIYYGFPEGPTASVNELSIRGNGQEKEQIAVSNGYQELLHKVFLAMNLVHRNSLTLQELIMQKTVTADRINTHENRKRRVVVAAGYR
jgi:hypothetical protein